MGLFLEWYYCTLGLYFFLSVGDVLMLVNVGVDVSDVGVDMTITFIFALLKIRFASTDHLEIDWVLFSIILIHASCWLALHTCYNIALFAYCRQSLSGVICGVPATHKLNNIGILILRILVLKE